MGTGARRRLSPVTISPKGVPGVRVAPVVTTPGSGVRLGARARRRLSPVTISPKGVPGVRVAPVVTTPGSGAGLRTVASGTAGAATVRAATPSAGTPASAADGRGVRRGGGSRSRGTGSGRGTNRRSDTVVAARAGRAPLDDPNDPAHRETGRVDGNPHKVTMCIWLNTVELPFPIDTKLAWFGAQCSSGTTADVSVLVSLSRVLGAVQQSDRQAEDDGRHIDHVAGAHVGRSARNCRSAPSG